MYKFDKQIIAMGNKEIEDKYESSLELIKITQLSKNGIGLNQEPIEIVNLVLKNRGKKLT